MTGSRKWIAKNVGYPLQDKLRGTNIIETIGLLRESQYWEESQINDYRLLKLKNLIDYSVKNVPYYEELFGRIKLKSSDIRNLDDVWKIPVLDKETLQKENNNLISRDVVWRYVKKGKTGGTTGVPTMVYKDANNRTFTWASYYRWYEWMGLNYYDSVATFWGARAVLSTSVKMKIVDEFSQFIQNNTILNSFNMNSKTANLYYKALRKQSPYLLKGYLSSLVDFAKYVERSNWELSGLKAISTTTETLLPNNREYLEGVFNVPVFDQYGCGEISAISYECPMHSGLHINQEHVICEILDSDNRLIFDQPGVVVATDLDNYVMPFLRYENGDIATVTEEKCSCGVNQPLMKSIEGRSADTIVLSNGSKVHGVFFTDILFEIGILSNEFQKFQVTQRKIGSIDFKLETQKKLGNSKAEKLKISLKRFFDDVEFSEVDQIKKEPNGKFKYIVSALGESISNDN